MNELWSYVFGGITKPALTPNPTNPNNKIPPDPVVLVAFRIKDNIALFFIHLIVENNVDQNIETTDTSHEAWNIICSLYEQKDDSKTVMLKARLYTIPFAGSIPSHMTKVKAIRN